MKSNTQERQIKIVSLYIQYLKGEFTQGSLLRQFRKDLLGFSQADFADLVGVSRKTIADIEGDKANPAQGVLDRAFKVFGLQSGVVPAHPQIMEQLTKQVVDDSVDSRFGYYETTEVSNPNNFL